MSMTPSRRKVEAYKLKHAAEDGRLIIYRCSLCRRVTVFLASDVVAIWNPEMSVLVERSACGQCQTAEFMNVDVRLPTSDDVGHLLVRRPAGTRTVQLWRDEWYGP